MKRKIRRGMFESNSSSSHSLTISSITDEKTKLPIAEYGILYPYRIEALENSIGSEGSSLVLRTKDEKLAWLYQVIDSAISNEEIESEFAEKLHSRILEAGGYESAEFEDHHRRWGRSACAEDGDSYSFKDEEVALESFEALLKIALDDNMQIADEDIPY